MLAVLTIFSLVVSLRVTPTAVQHLNAIVVTVGERWSDTHHPCYRGLLTEAHTSRRRSLLGDSVKAVSELHKHGQVSSQVLFVAVLGEEGEEEDGRRGEKGGRGRV